MSSKIKKTILTNLPYGIIALFATKVGLAWRLAEGSALREKIANIPIGFAVAFETTAPSLHPADLCVGIAISAIIRFIVYTKGKNAKKYRKNVEYGSARWGTPEDIRPFVDPVFRNNVILTQTERLTMNNRPKNPSTARNKNVLIIGGSGSGKTRFWLKPNLMQLHSRAASLKAPTEDKQRQQEPASMPKRTNADTIRSMTLDKLAHFLSEWKAFGNGDEIKA